MSLEVRRSRLPGLVLALAATLVLAGCTQDDRVRWHGLTVDVPDGWVIAEQDPSKLSLATARFTQEEADELRAAAFFTDEGDTTSVQDWVELVGTLEGGEVIEEQEFTIEGSPADLLTFTHAGNGTPLKEMVLVIPSRGVVALFQPVVDRGSDQGPATFDRYRDTFQRIIDSIELGAPPDA